MIANTTFSTKVLSSNVNEVTGSVLNSFFYENILHAPKAQKTPKAPKAQRRNQAKAQNATSKKKNKKCAQKHLKGKSHLFPYLRFYAFCAREEKIIKKREKSPQCNVLNTDVPTTSLMY